MVGRSFGRELGDRNEENASDLSIAAVVRGRDSDGIAFRYEYRRLKPCECDSPTLCPTERSAIEIDGGVGVIGTGSIYDYKADRIGSDCSAGYT